jgi:hypothetical protein
MDHNLTITERPANFPQYRWEVACSCGWMGRFGQEVNASSAGVAHGGVLPKKVAPKPVAPVPVAKPVVPVPVAKPAVPVAPKPATPTTTPAKLFP